MFRKPKLLLLSVLTVAAFLAAVVSGCSKTGSDSDSGFSAGSAAQKFHCPMHPTYVSNRPGDCPICNMKLVPIKENQPAPKAMKPADDEKTAHIEPGQFYCPMDTHIVSNAPAACPECNMTLIQKQPPGAATHGDDHSAGAAPVPGRISISLSPEKRQLIGLTLAAVEKRDLSGTVRAVGLVEHDETRYTRISPRFAGWVRELHVAYTGAPVEKGQPLLTVYSPEIFATENEYLAAWRTAQQMKGNELSVQQRSTEALLESARLRLSLLQIGDEEIRELEQRGSPAAAMLFRAPFSGHVIAKNAVEGAAFEAGETLYEIADLTHLWVRAYIPESDLPRIAVGQPAEVHFPNLDGRSFDATVNFIYPHIEAESRRAQIRVELDNPQHLVRPNMWGNVEIKTAIGEKLTVPASAVINTGLRYIAFVDGADEHLEPREVKVGAKTDDYYEVISGLQEGEKVVERALFLVDSESQLKAAIAGMTSSGHTH